MAWDITQLGRDLLRGGEYTLTHQIALFSGSTQVASDLRPLNGAVEDDVRRDNRRSFSATIAPDAALYRQLAQPGLTARITSSMGWPGSPDPIRIPMGVFDVRNVALDASDGISMSGEDLWGRVKRARFLRPFASTPGLLVTEQIAALLAPALGGTAAVNVLTRSTFRVGALVWERDRDKAITELAASIGAVVYFDRQGIPTIEDAPILGGEPAWDIDASATGVLLTSARSSSVERTYNVVVVNAAQTNGTDLFDPQIVWDNDPNSPTYAGPDPTTGVGSRMIPTPYFYESPLITSAFQAQVAGRAVLARTVGAASQVSLTAAPNVAIDGNDVLRVRHAQESEAVELHAVDKVTHPLTVSEPTRIEGRSSRTDSYT